MNSRILVSRTVLLCLLVMACETPTSVSREFGPTMEHGLASSTTGIPQTAGGSIVPSNRCTRGDAELLLNNFLGGLKLSRRDGSPSNPADAFTECQFRLYRDGPPVVFREGDVFLGGMNLLWDFATAELLGVNRQEILADMEATETRVWLARILPDGTPGPLVEQPLLRTPYKDGMHPTLGLVVQQHRAYITSLLAGEYVSVFEARWQEFHGLPAGELHSTVHIVIVP